jgi:hypothetical protein
MKTPIRIETRITRSYVGSCQHLDQWAPVCSARATGPYTVSTPDGEDPSEGLTRAFVVSLTATQMLEARKSYRRNRANGNRNQASIPTTFAHWLRRAIEDHYSSYGCHHEYDCCGCASVYADARPTGRGEFSVKARVSYNY